VREANRGVIAWNDLENGGNWGLELQNVFVIGVPQNTKIRVDHGLKAPGRERLRNIARLTPN
jgi:hypothetical protein